MRSLLKLFLLIALLSVNMYAYSITGKSDSDLASLTSKSALSDILSSNDRIDIYLKNGAWTRSIRFPLLRAGNRKVIAIHRSSAWEATAYLSELLRVSIPKGDTIFVYENHRWSKNGVKIKHLSIRNNADLRKLNQKQKIKDILSAGVDKLDIYLRDGAWTGSINLPLLRVKNGKVVVVHRRSTWGSVVHLDARSSFRVPKGTTVFIFSNGRWINSNTAFKFKIHGTNFRVPVDSQYKYSYSIDCDSDGIIEASNISNEYQCSYTQNAYHTIAIYGTFPKFAGANLDNDDKLKLTSIVQWGDIKWESMRSAFSSTSLTFIEASDAPDLSEVTDISYMFSKTHLGNVDLSKWDISNVTNTSYMFYGASNFNSDLSNWDMSNVTDMRFMFYYARSFSNNDLSNWDISNVGNKHNFFSDHWGTNNTEPSWADLIAFKFKILGTNFRVPVDSQYRYSYSIDCDDDGIMEASNISNAHQCSYAQNSDHTIAIYGTFPKFYGAGLGNDRHKLKSIVQWGDIRWQSMGFAFRNTSLTLIEASDVPDLSEVTDMSYMFADTFLGNVDLSSWDVSHVKNMSYMFYYATRFNSDLSNWNVSNATNMKSMFLNTKKFNADLSNWDVSSVTDMRFMFFDARAFSNHDLSNWEVSNVGDKHTYFSDQWGTNNIEPNWNWANTLNGKAFKFKIHGTNFRVPVDSQYRYSYSVDCDSDGNIEAFNINNDYQCSYSGNSDHIISIYGTFPKFAGIRLGDDRVKLRSIIQWGDIKWNSMRSAFSSTSLTFIEASDAPDLSEVTDMSYMFFETDLGNIDLSKWDISNVKNMSNMFAYASNFNSDLSNWDVSNVQIISWMFNGASSFNSDLSNWNVSSATDMKGMFYYASNFNSNLSSWDVSSATDMRFMFFNARAFSNNDLSNWNVANVGRNKYGIFSDQWGSNNTEPNWSN